VVLTAAATGSLRQPWCALVRISPSSSASSSSSSFFFFFFFYSSSPFATVLLYSRSGLHCDQCVYVWVLPPHPAPPRTGLTAFVPFVCLLQLQLGVLRRLVKEKGPLAIFAGLGPELVRGMLSGALMLMVKEYIDAIVMGAILGRSAAA
jgi:hypothetical protein